MIDIQERIKEHEQGIARGEETLRGMQAQAKLMQEQANAIMADIERRRGALLELRMMAGVPLDGSPPKEQANNVGAANDLTNTVIPPG